MQTISQIRAMLDERGLTPRHRLGQNFLHDKNQLAKLISAAEITPGSVVLEVGPGTGTLTETLLETGAEVIACELDAALADLIDDRLNEYLAPSKGTPRLTIIRGDALDTGRTVNPSIVAAIDGRVFKLVANLPYQIASPLMVALLIDHPNCAGQFITIQKEVADRLMAKPSTKAYGPLSIIVQAFADVKRISTLKPTCFWPKPKVDSAMVSLFPSPQSGGGGEREARGEGESHEVDALSSPDSRRAFARFVTELFMKRRKQLGTIFGRDARKWESLPREITPDLRPEALTIGQVIGLWRVMRGDP